MSSVLYLPRLPTLKDLDIKAKKVFMRIDINVPIDPDTGKIVDERRIRIHSQSIKKIMDEHTPALVLGSHQGRPGSYEFVTLEQHAELLAKYSGLDVKYVQDVIGPTARDEIRKLRPGEVLLLDNLRLVSEEILEAPPEKQALTIMVKRLSPLFEAYINDAFATAHRSQPSIVGMPLALPSAIGLLFEKELNALGKTVLPQNIPRIFILGGKKVPEALRVIENLTRNKLAERILTTGLLAQLFLVAKGVDVGIENLKVLEENGLLPLVPRARYMLMRGAPVETPVDFIVRINNDVKNLHVGELKGGVIRDIGENTVNIYKEFIKEAKVVVIRGPSGVIEEGFVKGTVELMNAVYDANAFTLIAGGQVASMVNESMINEKIHVSTGGNAVLLFLSGEELPALKAMELSARMFLGWTLLP